MLEERSGKIFVTSESHPLRAREVGPEEVELWVPDWRKISEQLSSALGFFSYEPRGEGTTRQIGNIHSRKLASRPVFLHIPTGGNADCMSPLNEMATMQSSALKPNFERSSRFPYSKHRRCPLKNPRAITPSRLPE